MPLPSRPVGSLPRPYPGMPPLDESAVLQQAIFSQLGGPTDALEMTDPIDRPVSGVGTPGAAPPTGGNTTQPGGATPPVSLSAAAMADPASSRYAPRLTGNTLTEHGNTRTLQDHEVGGAQSYVDDYWRQFPTGFQPGVGPQTNAEYDAPSGGAGGGTGGGTGNTTSHPGPAAGQRFGGFDFARPQDISKSAKDAFAHYARASGRMPQSKQEAEDWFTEFIQPGLKAQGFEVDWVRGDLAFIRTRENPQGEIVDFLVNAGSDNPDEINLAWQSQGPGGGEAGPSAPPAAGPTGGTDFGSEIQSLFGPYLQSGNPENDEAMRKIMAEIERIINGNPNDLLRGAISDGMTG